MPPRRMAGKGGNGGCDGVEGGVVGVAPPVRSIVPELVIAPLMVEAPVALIKPELLVVTVPSVPPARVIDPALVSAVMPVKELAQPALTTSARRSRPPLPSRWRLHQSTGAEPTPWRVKTPAQVVPSANLIKSTSGRSCL